MKRILPLTLCVLSTWGLVTASAQETKAAAPASAPMAAPATRTYTNEELANEFGWFIGKRIGLTELNLSKSEVEALLKGLSSAAEGKESPFVLEEVGPKMDEFMQKKQAVAQQAAKAKATAANAGFLAKLKENKAVVFLPDGLGYEILKEGTGPNPVPSDTVKVNYVGTLTDGSVFDSSIQRGEPAEFLLSQVITGWTEGIQKVKKGGKIKLYIPSELGYGDQAQQGIPANSMLIFDVDLLDIKPAAAAAPEIVLPAAK